MTENAVWWMYLLSAGFVFLCFRDRYQSDFPEIEMSSLARLVSQLVITAEQSPGRMVVEYERVDLDVHT